MLFKIDNLSDLADEFGEEQSNELLIKLRQQIASELNTEDCIARFGDATFLILLTEQQQQAASSIQQRLSRIKQALSTGGLSHTYGLNLLISDLVDIKKRWLKQVIAQMESSFK